LKAREDRADAVKVLRNPHTTIDQDVTKPRDINVPDLRCLAAERRQGMIQVRTVSQQRAQNASMQRAVGELTLINPRNRRSWPVACFKAAPIFGCIPRRSAGKNPSR
jgi:hypothetical protein